MLLIGLTLAAVVLGAARAIAFRTGLPAFVPTDEAIASYYVDKLPEAVVIQPHGAKPDSAQAMWDASDIIVQVSPTGYREAHTSEVLSEVEVTAVLKAGRDVAPGEKLLVYEPIFITPPTTRPTSVTIRGVNMLMQADRSYVLCLKFYEKPEGYRYREAERRTYLLAFPTCGVFPLRESMSVFFVPSQAETGPLYAEMRPYDCLPESEEEFQAFSALRAELFALLGLTV
jgi:hypothetical protein